MLQVVVHRPGGHARLSVERRPDSEGPAPGPGEALVGVEAVGVNFADCAVRMGLYESARLLGYPITPGFELAGRVLALGDGAEEFVPGDPVFGVVRFGAYASRVVAPARQLRAIPAGWSAAQAAGFPTVFLTAWYALHELARARPGARVLVHSAAGGVGGALLQLAAAAGCRALGAVGAPHKVEVAHEQGAEAVVDTSRADLWAAAREFAPDGFDAVFDANGPATLRESYRNLAREGRLVVYGFHAMLRRFSPGASGRPPWARLGREWLSIPRFSPLDLVNANKSVMGFNLSFLFDRSELFARAMDELLALAERGRIRPQRVRTFPLERAAEAHQALESGATVGKLVLVT